MALSTGLVELTVPAIVAIETHTVGAGAKYGTLYLCALQGHDFLFQSLHRGVQRCHLCSHCLWMCVRMGNAEFHSTINDTALPGVCKT